MTQRRKNRIPATGNPDADRALDRLASDGRYLVIISDHHKACDRCARWEGKVLSITGTTTGSVKTGDGHDIKIAGTLTDALSSGLFHDGCRHSLGAFIEGLSTPPTPRRGTTMTDLPPPPDAPPPAPESAGSKLGRWKDKAVDAASKANEARLEHNAKKAAKPPKPPKPIDLNKPIAEINQSRFSNTVHPERLIVYPDRVEYAAKGFIRKAESSVHFTQLAQVRIDSSLMHATLIVESSGGAALTIDKLPKGDAEDARRTILSAADAWRNRSTTQPPPPTPASSTPAADDVATKLANLASLHASGALADDEFAAAKARLLG